MLRAAGPGLSHALQFLLLLVPREAGEWHLSGLFVLSSSSGAQRVLFASGG